jgi:hypothetical protein
MPIIILFGMMLLNEKEKKSVSFYCHIFIISLAHVRLEMSVPLCT